MRGRNAYLLAAVLLVLTSGVSYAAYPAPCNLAGCVKSGSSICGVAICGLCYDCGVSDGVCPSTYQPGASCDAAHADPDCGVLFENTPALCSDGIDNDGADGADFADATPSPLTNPGQSCNVCDAAACAALPQTGGVSLAPQASVSKPVSTPAQTWINGTALQPGTKQPPGGPGPFTYRLDSDGSGLGTSPSCWCAVCQPGYTWSGAACVFNPPTIALTATPAAGTVPPAFTVTQLQATGTFPAGTGPVNVYIDTDGNPNTWELSCLNIAASPFTCTKAVALAFNSAGVYTRFANVTDANGYSQLSSVNINVASVGAPSVSSFTATPAQSSAPQTVTLTLSGTFSTPSALFEIDTDNNVGNGYEQTANLAGSPNTFTYNVPLLPAGVHTFNARITDSVSQQAVAAPQSVTIVAGPQIASITALPASVVAPGSTVITAQGTFGAPAASIQLDNNSNAANYEVMWNTSSSPGFGSISAVVAGPPAKTFYVQINDTYGKRVNGSIVVPVTVNQPPTVPWINVTVIPRFGSADVSVNVTVTDDQVGWGATLDWGDGSPSTPLAVNSPSLSTNFLALAHTYFTVPSSPIILVTATDAAALVGTNQTTVSAAGLPCVTGTQTGNATYNNNGGECCANSCNASVAGWQSCFASSPAPPACYPSNAFICGWPNPVPPPTENASYIFVDRDTSQGTCVQNTPTCSLLPWTDFNDSAGPTVGRCCGDDVGDVLVQAPNIAPTLPPGSTACCAAPNNCYTDVGIASGCRVSAAESGVACGDGIDNDCNGVVDDGPLCSTQLYGQVKLDDGSGNAFASLPAAVGATVTLNTTSTNTDSQGNYSLLVPVAPGTYSVYAGLFGYSVNTTSVATTWGGTYNVDFTLTPRVCNADCTNGDGFCDSSCIGVGPCQPSPPELETLYLCHPSGQVIGYSPGTRVVLSQNATTVVERSCCTNPQNLTRDIPVPVVQGSPESLGRLTRTFANGLRLVIITWYS